jgi:hypothetical protein
VRPSGDDPNFFSTSAMGRVFKSSFASDSDVGFDSGGLGFESSVGLGLSALGFMIFILSLI